MKIIKYSLAILGILLVISSCTKIDPDLNINPNAPAEVPTASLLLQAERGLASEEWDEWNNGRFGLLYSQFWAQANYTDESRYLYRSGSVNSFWNAIYSGGMMDLQQIMAINSADGILTPGELNENAIAMILQSYFFQLFTDIWGNVPYSDALKGAESARPKYDSQKDIYVGLINNLKKAIADLDANKSDGTSFGASDVIYNGDAESWIKFGNALLMRVCMRVADRSSDLSSDGIDVKGTYETAAQNTISSNAESAMFRFLTAQPNTNPLYVDRVNRKDADFAVSKTLTDVMNALGPSGDPRLMYYSDTSENGGFNGVPYGLSSANAAAYPIKDISYPSGARALRTKTAFGPTDVIAPSAPAFLLDYAEVCFMNAEAAERGWTVPMGAKDYYDAGITASMEYWGNGNISAIDISAYIADPSVDYNTVSGSWKEKIGKQKWLALYMQGVQGWTEWRRLDFGILQLPVDGVLLGVGIPNRYAYPTNESTINNAHYNEAVSSQGPDDQATKLWWDVN